MSSIDRLINIRSTGEDKMTYSPAQKTFLKKAHNDPQGKVYLADIHPLTVQSANGWWKTGDALTRQGIFRKVDGVDAFQLVTKEESR